MRLDEEYVWKSDDDGCGGGEGKEDGGGWTV